MFTYQNKTKNYINKEIDTKLGELTQQGLVKSEQEYKKVIEELLESADLDLGRLTSATKHLATPDTVVSSANLNEMFTNLEADLRVLHKELADGHKVLDMSLSRNKIFYRRIKSKIASMWKEIGYFRETSFNTESADYTFFEGFDSDDSAMTLSNMTIDKKTGVAHLTPVAVRTFNESRDVQEVVLSIYPPENVDGGVYNTTHPANDIKRHYEKDTRDMMKNGLWKVQTIAADVPETPLDVFGKGNTTNYNGLVAYVDIVFTGPKMINEIGLDPYGEFRTKLVGVRYKKSLDAGWETATTTDDDQITTAVNGEDADWIYIRNINPIHARVLRLVVHQENHTVLSKLLSGVDQMVDKMVKDLAEGRYEKQYYKYKTVDAFPRVSDKDKDQGNLYDEVMDAIEEEKDVETLEARVGDLLVPKPIDAKHDIQNWKVYNTGAWSIEPKSVQFAPAAVGEYISHDTRDKDSGFRLNSGAPTEVTMYTKQTEPNGTLIEWYVLADNGSSKPIEIPIMPNNDRYRTEGISYGKYYPMANTVTGKTYRTTTTMRNVSNMIKLDFPIHPRYLSEVILYENGTEVYNENSYMVDVRGKLIESYNSTELYIPDVELKGGRIYTIKYIPALIDTVQCWVLQPSDEPTPGFIDAGSAMVFANEQWANYMKWWLPRLDLKKLGAPEHVAVSDNYVAKMHLCTRTEYDDWFQGGRTGIFIDACLDTDDRPGIEWLYKDWSARIHNSTTTKLTWLYERDFAIKPYSDDSTDAYTWAELPAAPPLLAVKDKQYNLTQRG